MKPNQDEIHSINSLQQGEEDDKYKRLHIGMDENFFIKSLVHDMENNICFILHNNSTEVYREVAVSEYELDRFQYFIKLKSKLYYVYEESEYYEQFLEEISLGKLDEETVKVLDQLNAKIETFLKKIKF